MPAFARKPPAPKAAPAAGMSKRRLPMTIAVARRAAAASAVVVRERVGPWSAWSYLSLARANSAYAWLTRNEDFVLGLLAVRASDAGRVTFARRDLVRLYGIEPGDIDARPFLRALDSLTRAGWLHIEERQGRANTYRLVLPRKRRTRRVRWCNE